MPNEQYQLGSRKNPYTQYQYETSNSWSGGWVLINANLIYITNQRFQYSGKGEHDNPYSSTVYEDMCINHFWTGGWVQVNEVDVEYVTQGGTHYTETEGAFGSQQNPCPVGVFENMCTNGLWNGGWVLYPDGSVYHMFNMEVQSSSSSSGCGCGSGSGSGSGNAGGGTGHITSGCFVAATFECGAGELVVYWSGGFITHSPFATVGATANFDNDPAFYRMDSCQLNASWHGGYGIAVTGTIVYTYCPHWTGPNDEYQKTLHINEEYTLPASYIDQM